MVQLQAFGCRFTAKTALVVVLLMLTANSVIFAAPNDDESRPAPDSQVLDSKREETKKDDSKREDESKKDEIKKDESNRDEKKVDGRKVEAKKDDMRKVDPKKDDAKKVDAKKDDTKKVDAKKDDAKKDDAKKLDAREGDRTRTPKEADLDAAELKSKLSAIDSGVAALRKDVRGLREEVAQLEGVPEPPVWPVVASAAMTWVLFGLFAWAWWRIRKNDLRQLSESRIGSIEALRETLQSSLTVAIESAVSESVKSVLPSLSGQKEDATADVGSKLHELGLLVGSFQDGFPVAIRDEIKRSVESSVAYSISASLGDQLESRAQALLEVPPRFAATIAKAVEAAVLKSMQVALTREMGIPPVADKSRVSEPSPLKTPVSPDLRSAPLSAQLTAFNQLLFGQLEAQSGDKTYRLEEFVGRYAICELKNFDELASQFNDKAPFLAQADEGAYVVFFRQDGPKCLPIKNRILKMSQAQWRPIFQAAGDGDGFRVLEPASVERGEHKGMAGYYVTIAGLITVGS